MNLTNELAIDAPIDRTWAALLDVPRVARALPGATVEPEPVDGVHRGGMRVRLGALALEYTGTVQLQEVDDDERLARFRAAGRELRGQGFAEARITARLRDGGARTHLAVETELDVRGRPAQLGAGLMEQVAGNVLERFAEGLERELRGEPEAATAQAHALDLGRALARPLLERGVLVAAGAAAGLAAGWLLWRRR